jgi:hypothetical protein
MQANKAQWFWDTYTDLSQPVEIRLCCYLLALVHEVPEALVDQPALNVDRECIRLLDSMACVNCGRMVGRPSLVCGDFCQQMAKTIRSVRRCITDGRIDRVDVQGGIGKKLFHLNGGGYPQSQRRLASSVRLAVFERDHWKCTLCGEAATQIDHIAGSSSDMLNLRAACADCNWREAAKKATATSTAEERAEFDAMYELMAFRIRASNPTRLCDDEREWKVTERSLRPERRRQYLEWADAEDGEFDDVDGYLGGAMRKDD